MIEISWPLLITQVVTFLAAMVVVWKLFWGPLTQLMNERAEKISHDLQRAEAGRKEIEALEADYRHRLSEIEESARKEISEAVQRGNAVKDDILKQARDEARQVLEKAQRDLAQEREQVIVELRRHVTDLSLAAVERILGEAMDRKVQQRLVDDFLNDLKVVETAR